MPLRCLAPLFPAYSPINLLPSSPALVAGLPYFPPSNHHLARIFNTRAYTRTPTFRNEELRRRVLESRWTRCQGVSSLSLYRLELCAMRVATHLGAVQKMEDERSLRVSALRLE